MGRSLTDLSQFLINQIQQNPKPTDEQVLKIKLDAMRTFGVDRSKVQQSIKSLRNMGYIPHGWGFNSNATVKKVDMQINPNYKPIPIEEREKAAFEELKRRSLFSRQWILPKQEVYEINLPERPFGIVNFSDFHIGNAGTVLEELEKDIELLVSTPGLYAVIGGDSIDNHIKILSAIIKSNTTPQEQFYALGYVLKRMAPKLLAMISGNHEGWSSVLNGLDAQGVLAKQLKIIYDPEQIFLTINIGEASYRFGIRHKYRFNSAFNPTHSVKRWWENSERDCDIMIVNHHHYGTIESFERHGRKRWAIRGSTYLLWDEYARKCGYAKISRPEHPMVVIYPNDYNVIGFVDFRTGIDFLRSERERYK